MAITNFTLKGIKYVSNSNGYFLDEHNHYYLKYRPASEISINNITLSPNADYFVTKYSGGAIQLSLSHLPAEDATAVIGTITTSITNLLPRLNMPAAKIRFHPNGGVITGGTSDSEGFYTLSNKAEVIESAMNLSGLVSRSGYTQISWRIGHITGIEIASFSSVNLHADHPITYPQTEIRLIAEWKDSAIDTESYEIRYFANNVLYKTQSYTYHPTETIRLNAPAPAKDKHTHLGWSLSKEEVVANTDVFPDYNLNSEFLRNQRRTINLYALWVKGQTYTVRFDNMGGKEGQGDTEMGWEVWKFPGINSTINSNSFTKKTGIPKRRGYNFNGWVSKVDGSHAFPGQTCMYAVNSGYHRDFQTDWSRAQTLYVTNEFVSYTTYHICDGQIRSWIIQPPYQATYTIQGIGSTTQIIRITDELDNELIFQTGSKYITNTNKATIELEKGKTYQLEICGLSGTNGGFKIKKDPVIRTLTLNPQGGVYRISSSTTTSTANHIHNFYTDKTYVGISTTEISGTNSGFTGEGYLTSSAYPGQPIKNGYQFSQWIGSDGIVDVVQKSLEGSTLYTTNYVPSINFITYAHWHPNRCFIIYDGNGSTAGDMPNSEHFYNISSSVFPNNYQKTTKIIFNSRGGLCTQNSDWTDSTYIDADLNTQSMIITHTFNEWNTNKNATGTSYSGKVDDCGSITFTDTAYGATQILYAIWNLNIIKLPKVERAGFDFMGWYKADGTRVGGVGDSYTYGDSSEITLYAHWEPIGLVQIYTNEGWKYAIPYIYAEDPETKQVSWKRAMSYTHDGTDWKQGAGSGQNMTDDQLEEL